MTVRHCPSDSSIETPLCHNVIKGICSAGSQRDHINMDTTNIFPFLAIFGQNLTVLPQNIIFFIYPALQPAISYINFMNYPHAKCIIISSSNLNTIYILQFLVHFAQICLFYPKNIKTTYDSRGFTRF